jgi:hypothetical protein
MLFDGAGLCLHDREETATIGMIKYFEISMSVTIYLINS